MMSTYLSEPFCVEGGHSKRHVSHHAPCSGSMRTHMYESVGTPSTGSPTPHLFKERIEGTMLCNKTSMACPLAGYAQNRRSPEIIIGEGDWCGNELSSKRFGYMFLFGFLFYVKHITKQAWISSCHDPLK
jgi:hypothetical protein